MDRARFALIGAAVLLAAVVGGAQQTVTSEAVLIRDAKNQLMVTMIVAKPGDRVEVSDGVVVVNGRRTDVRVQRDANWGPKVIEPNTYFVAGDPAKVGTDPRGWGLIAAERIIGTVQIGVLPTR